MAIREIITYPNPRLAIPSEDVKIFDQDLKALVNDMIDTMYDASGIGLAAPQINVHKKIFVIDIDYRKSEEKEDEGTLTNKNPRVFINPILLNPEGETLYKEGCLSVPGIYEEVKRAEIITVQYQDVQGISHKDTVDGLLAVALQHENDHLLGRLFIDRLSFMKSRTIKKRIKRELKEGSLEEYNETDE